MKVHQTSLSTISEASQNLSPSDSISSRLDRMFFAGVVAGTFGSAVVFCGLAAILFLSFGGSAFGHTPKLTLMESDRSRIDSQEQRPIGEIRRDTDAFIKRSKRKDDPLASTGAIVDLCRLHAEIVEDGRFSTNDRLKSFRANIATRLNKYMKQIKIDMKRRARSAAKEARQAKSRSKNSKKNGGYIEPLDSDVGDLSETDMVMQPGANLDDALARSMADDYYSMSKMTGGPVRVWGYVGGNFAPPWDHGPDLVRLIESTISPEFWKTNGGDGVIHYYQPLRILVISATSRVHDDVTDMLRNMRRLGR